MANPVGTEFLSIPLRNFSVAQMQSATNFLARRMLTPIPVAQQSAPYYVYPTSDWLRSEAQLLGRGSESAGGGWHLSSDNYNAKVYAVHKDNDDQDYANANASGILSLDQDATAYVTEQMMILEDTHFAQKLMPDAGGVWTVELIGVGSTPVGTQFLQWDDPDSKPRDVIRDANLALAKRNLGRKANVLIVPPEALEALIRNPQIVDLYQFTQGGVITEAMVAAALGVDRIETAWAMQNKGKEGLADNIDYIFGKNALLAYFAPSSGAKINTAAGMFTWTQMDGGSSIGTRVNRIPAPLIHSTRVEAMAAYDIKVINANAATLFLSVIG